MAVHFALREPAAALADFSAVVVAVDFAVAGDMAEPELAAAFGMVFLSYWILQVQARTGVWREQALIK